MKKLVGILVILLLCMLAVGVCAQEEGVSLKKALMMLNDPDCPAMILLDDNMLDYVPFSEDTYSLNTGKFIILQREAPLKEYSLTFVEPTEYYQGNDIGTYKTYLCAELMKLIPEEKRATLLKDVGNIIMNETFYYCDGHIYTRTGGSDQENRASDDVLELMLQGKTDEAEQMQQALQHDESDVLYEYHPVFSAVNFVGLYNKQNHSFGYWRFGHSKCSELRNNPAADDLWYEIEYLCQIALLASEEDPAAYSMMRDSVYFFDDALLQTFATLDYDDYDEVFQQCEKGIWEIAAQLSLADGDKRTMAQYQQVIDQRNLAALQYVAMSRNYSGVYTPHEKIERERLYIGTPQDINEYQTKLRDFCEFLDLIDWDMQEFVGFVETFNYFHM